MSYNAGSHQMAPSDWIPLDDQYNMIDESTIPADYYIDKPVSLFIFVSFSLFLA